MKKLLLGLLLAGDEVHVVDEQDVNGPIFAPKLLSRLHADRGDQLVGEYLGGNVDDTSALCARLASDGLEQMGLAESAAAIQKQGVVFGTRSLGHRECYGVRHS